MTLVTWLKEWRTAKALAGDISARNALIPGAMNARISNTPLADILVTFPRDRLLSLQMPHFAGPPALG